jgi:hypothetical protein
MLVALQHVPLVNTMGARGWSVADKEGSISKRHLE